jgi:ferredoxin--NADP+ reductase
LEIISKFSLASEIKQLVIKTPEVSSKALPGQFVIIRVSEKGERIPLTISSTNLEDGTITIVFQEVGRTTKLLGKLDAGEYLRDLVGPLGRPTEIKKYGEVIAVGGGVGIAEILPVVKALKGADNKITSIIGAKSSDMLIYENELRSKCDELLISTDNGSRGRKGFVSDWLEVLLAERKSSKMPDYVYAVGPVPMMKRVCNITRDMPAGMGCPPIKTTVSLNPIMIDGTGMCGSCRVTVGGELKFACVDGPEFDGHKVEWDELLARNRFFLEQEKISAGRCHCKK